MCIVALIIDFVIWVLFIIFLMSFVFPLPINDVRTTRYRTIPWITILLMLINSLVFLTWLGSDLYNIEQWDIYYLQPYLRKISAFGFREQQVRDGTGIGALTTFTSMFMHADIWHLFGNMAFLWAFGRRVEDACGHWRYLMYYLLAGMVANMGSALLNPALVDRPGVGASGAIAGVMGAYLLLFPTARVNSLWGIGAILRIPVAAIRSMSSSEDIPIWRWALPLPAWLLVGVFVIENLMPSIETIRGGEDVAGVNYLAHLTGFLAALVIFLFVRKDLLRRYFSGRSV